MNQLRCPNPVCDFPQVGIFVSYFEFSLGWCPKCGTICRIVQSKAGFNIVTHAVPDPKKTVLIVPKGINPIKDHKS